MLRPLLVSPVLLSTVTRFGTCAGDCANNISGIVSRESLRDRASPPFVSSEHRDRSPPHLTPVDMVSLPTKLKHLRSKPSRTSHPEASSSGLVLKIAVLRVSRGWETRVKHRDRTHIMLGAQSHGKGPLWQVGSVPHPGKWHFCGPHLWCGEVSRRLMG